MSISITFTKVVPSGQAFAHHNGKALFCFGPLPDEICEVEITKETSSYCLARLASITKASPARLQADAAPYAIWQGVDYKYQLELKRAMLEELYAKQNLTVSDVIPSPITDKYRNKLSFALIYENGAYQLGMHLRGSKHVVSTSEGCGLGDDRLNQAAIAVLERLNASSIGDNATELTVRRGSDGKIVAILSLAKRKKIDFQSLRAPGLAGLVVVVDTKVAWSYGDATLAETVAGTTIQVPAHEFMQVNVPAFELALAEITKAVPSGAHVLDLYGGAGTIGLALAATHDVDVLGVEVNLDSVKLAKTTAAELELANYKVTSADADMLSDTIFRGIDTVIVDPPRAGLSRDLIDQLIRLRVERIIYLSCDPVTQARDTALLSDVYRAETVTGFDFYPQTPHLESLVVFDIITKL